MTLNLPALPFRFPRSPVFPAPGPRRFPGFFKFNLPFEGIFRRDATYLDDLALIPGNTAKAHGRPFSTWLFFRFLPGATAPATQLRKFAMACRRAKFHTSLLEQLQQWSAYKARETELRGAVPETDAVATAPFGTVLLTGLSFRILDAGRNGYRTFLTTHAVFDRGMTKDREILQDPLPGDDNDTWRGHGFEEEFHVALFLAGNTRAGCDQHVANALKIAASCQLVEAHRENGFIWRPEGPGTAMREPFGFADGLSNLLFLAEDVDAHRASGVSAWDPVSKWSNVLFLPDAPPKSPTDSLAGGSFVVLRKLEQDVAAFRRWEAQSVKGNPPPGATEPGAGLVGRTRTGCPLTGVPASGRLNDFGYGDDSKGSVCPFRAHIRKANPRGTSQPLGEEASTLFVRRGMVYAPKDQLTLDDRHSVGDGVGLLFTGYMGNIDRQFRFMQGGWLLNPHFPASGESGYDPLATLPPLKSDLPTFVIPRGGGYFFAPPVSWVEDPL